MSFKEFNFNPSISEALDCMGFENATPIQQEAIPAILDNKDLIACAQTGTGKTAAFLLPILNKIASEESSSDYINTLVIAPTRELALQIDQQVEAFGYFVGISSIPVYGGGSSETWEQQKSALTNGVNIVIATPGRLIAHMNLGYVKFDQLKHLILDEADRMLDMGFNEDIMRIVDKLPKSRQTLFFSATMPDKIRILAKKLLKNPQQINIAISKPAEGVLQAAYMAYDTQKIPLITKLLHGKTAYPSVLVFASTRKKVKEIARALNKDFNAREISSDLDQKAREHALIEFKSKRVQILVATDILARGIDIKEINLVINYDVPNDAEDYVHRIGRTARADSTGVAITLISDNDQHRFHDIETLIDMEIRKMQPPAEIGEGPTYDPKKKKKRSFNKGRGKSNRNYKGRSKSRNGKSNSKTKSSSNRNSNPRR